MPRSPASRAGSGLRQPARVQSRRPGVAPALSVRLPRRSPAQLLLRRCWCTAVAKGLYLGLDESWSPWDIYHRPIVYQRLDAIAEAEGRADDAIEHYSRLVDLWHDCDPALVPTRDEIARRPDALLARR